MVRRIRQMLCFHHRCYVETPTPHCSRCGIELVDQDGGDEGDDR